MYMQIKNYKIRFTDSVNFIQSRLADFPKTFGLTEMKKGYFPHFFNVPENQDYVGPIPDIKYYGPDKMMSDNRKKFLKWHQDRIDENYMFDFRKELEDYCRSDLDILRRSMMKFREDFITIANIDPLQYITIASVCMNVYRSKFMQKDTIGIIKDDEKTETFSKISMNWLKWISDTQNIHIQHAMNGGEYNITIVGKVGGFCKATNTIYEFQGCLWHGCEKCYTKDTINPCNQMEMGELQNKTKIKNKKITDLGYNLIEVYECELTKNSDFKKWPNENDVKIITPLNPLVLYLSLVRVLFAYASQVWSPQTVSNIVKIEKVQRRATKFILSLPYKTDISYKERLQTIHILPVCYWQKYLDMVYIYKCLVYKSDENISIKRCGRVTRMNDITNGILLEIPRSRTVAYKNSFYVRAPSVWNTLPKDLRDTTRSISSFKTNLCQFYNKLLDDIFDPEDSRTYKTVCIKCHSTRSLLTLSTFSCC